MVSIADSKNEIDMTDIEIFRAWQKMRNAGYSLSILNDALAVEPATLDERQQQFVMKVRDRFIQLLHDAKFVEGLVEEAGTSGLDWKQGTETWDDVRLLAANEVLYATNRIVNYDGVRYHQSHVAKHNEV